MKFAALVLKTAVRNKRRTLLTVLSLGVSLFLLVTLHTVLYELQATSTTPESDLRLWTRHSVSIANWLPLAYREQIQQVPGVKDVMVANWFGGIYIDEGNFFAQFAVDADKAFQVYPEWNIDPQQRENFIKERTAAVAGVRLFERFGWKIGDRITLKGTIYPVDAELKLGGKLHLPNSARRGDNLVPLRLPGRVDERTGSGRVVLHPGGVGRRGPVDRPDRG